MNKALFLTRVTLRRDAPIAALRSVFLPEEEERRVMIGHRLIWTLFGDSPDRKRDFLWREAGEGRFFTLSERPPEDLHDVFDVDPAKEFSPVLHAGQRLRFSLRANATVARRTEGALRGKPADVVMDALYRVPKGQERAEARAAAVQVAGLDWLARQGERNGFSFDRAVEGGGGARVMGYNALRLDHRRGDMKIGVLDFEGELRVTDPGVFLSAIVGGFGRAKAFGCGLMLIRRASC